MRRQVNTINPNVTIKQLIKTIEARTTATKTIIGVINGWEKISLLAINHRYIYRKMRSR